MAAVHLFIRSRRIDFFRRIGDCFEVAGAGPQISGAQEMAEDINFRVLLLYVPALDFYIYCNTLKRPLLFQLTIPN